MATASSRGFFPMGGEHATHLYSLCYFCEDAIVPDVELFEAVDDDEAILLARSRRPAMVREIWDRHRLVARISDHGAAVG